MLYKYRCRTYFRSRIQSAVARILDEVNTGVSEATRRSRLVVRGTVMAEGVRP